MFAEVNYEKENICIFRVFARGGGGGGPVYADKDPTLTAPKEQAGALIIYNKATTNSNHVNNNRYSDWAMGTFRAALDQDILHLTYSGANIDGGIPPINPRLKMVNILSCTGTNGFDADLKSKFYNKGNTTIDGQIHNGDLFDKLYDAGNPLSYWQSVYDLRFWADDTPPNISVISTGTSKTSDYSYYKEHLKAGGALFLQAEYSLFPQRNNGVLTCINDFTRESDWTNGSIGAGTTMTSFNFGTFEDFNKDFNDLNSLKGQYPMTWVNAGGYPTNSVKSGKSLVTSGSLSVIIIWGTEEMAPEIGNGRLIVSFDINAWGDYANGKISRTTMAVIQNIYDLMRGTSQYGVFKTFSKSQAEVGDIVKCTITIKNTATYEINVGTISDTLSGCFEYKGNTTGTAPKITNLSGGRTLLEWSDNKLSGAAEKTVSFDVKILRVPPCN